MLLNNQWKFTVDAHVKTMSTVLKTVQMPNEHNLQVFYSYYPINLTRDFLTASNKKGHF